MIEIADLRALVAVVETASFTEAARRLQTAKSVVSRRISEIERKLGAPLLDRSARSVRATEVGAVYYAKCVRLLEAFTAANEFVANTQGQVNGRLRLAVPRTFDERRVGVLLSRFALAYPDVLLHVEYETPSGNEAHFDVALRLGELEDSSLVARQIAQVGYALYASPEYLQQRGVPTQPQELEAHDALIEGGDARAWRYLADGKWHAFRVNERMRSDSLRHLLAAAESGLGIVAAPRFLVADAVAAQRLRPVLDDTALPAFALSAVYPGNRRNSQKIQRFIAFLVESAPQLYA
ncbi:DNA-binding transcriptional LysR family regulator [Xanthomonas sacchari]|uniref:LysR family transcriptional regulator n=1 Tax=Xanthomonas sacchari TaxID=56458 RepID=UPI0027879561|nr:LysR family transcriptional regulator [Xanthomonas sacchari]MDQ1091821.1 DNA-binding transcriptional LysR family regulator [Xanthomonas sacchari]